MLRNLPFAKIEGFFYVYTKIKPMATSVLLYIPPMKEPFTYQINGENVDGYIPEGNYVFYKTAIDANNYGWVCWVPAYNKFYYTDKEDLKTLTTNADLIYLIDNAESTSGEMSSFDFWTIKMRQRFGIADNTFLGKLGNVLKKYLLWILLPIALILLFYVLRFLYKLLKRR